MRSVSIFGATGSIGESAFDLLMGSGGPAAWRTVALTGGRNIARLAEMARALNAELAVIADPSTLGVMRKNYHKMLEQKVVKEVAKTLTAATADEIARALA